MWAHLDGWISLKSPNTQRKYKTVLREFLFIANIERTEEGFERFKQISPVDANRYLNWCKTRPAQPGRSAQISDKVSASTVKHKALVMFSICQEMISQGYLTTNPFLRAKRELAVVKGNDRRPHALIDFRKVEELLSMDFGTTPEGLRDRAMVACLFGGALRISEVLGLRLCDVRSTPKGNIILNLKATKRGRAEGQVLPSWAGTMVEDCVRQRRIEGGKDDEPLFVRYENGKPVPAEILQRTYYRWFKAMLVRLGVSGNVSPHWARATAITKLLSDGFTHREVMAYARHSSPTMTAHYDKLLDVEGEDVAANLDYAQKRVLRRFRR